LRSTRAL